MHLKIPREVLEEIFAHPAITEKDLFQLQLTCKYWSPVAQKHLYKELTLVLKKGLYRPPDGMETTIRLWVQRLLLLNVQIRKLVKRINVGSLFVHYDRKNEAQEKVIVNLATALHLCPNVTTLIGRNLPASLYEALSGLHASDNLQHLEHLSEPNIQSEKDWKALAPSYYKAIVGFKNTLKDITVFDAIGKKAAIDILIQPDYLQLFPCLEHLHLNELSRIHLFRLGRYISNCSARTRSISVEMGDATSVPLSPEYNEQSSITPQPQVKRLSMAICAKPLTANEMAYIMQMFPSLEHFSLATTMDVREGCIVPILHDTDVVFQFLNYLSRISQVGFGEIWFDASEGLALLPRLADLLNPHQVTIEYAEIDFLDIFSIKWDHETRSTRTDSNDNDANTTSKHSSLTIQIFSTDIQTKFYRALEVFKDRPVVINIGQYAPRSSFTDRQEITEESLDYIVNKSANILDTLTSLWMQLTGKHLDGSIYNAFSYANAQLRRIFSPNSRVG
ncbi:hypothetical protein MBANPS3_007531 [Mucor bainieri]